MRRWASVVLAALLAVLLLPVTAFAVEAGGEAPKWWGDVQLWEIVVAIVAFVWGLVKARYELDAKKNAKIVTFLEMGVQQAYDEFVRSAKAQAPKGKLTDDQVREARDKAWAAAKGYAATEGFDLVAQVAADQIPVLLTKIVLGIKKKK